MKNTNKFWNKIKIITTTTTINQNMAKANENNLFTQSLHKKIRRKFLYWKFKYRIQINWEVRKAVYFRIRLLLLVIKACFYFSSDYYWLKKILKPTAYSTLITVSHQCFSSSNILFLRFVISTWSSPKQKFYVHIWSFTHTLHSKTEMY